MCHALDTVACNAILKCEYFCASIDFAARIGAIMAKIIANFNVPLENIELMDHSLGGQIIGFAGCALNGKVRRIMSKLKGFGTM